MFATVENIFSDSAVLQVLSQHFSTVFGVALGVLLIARILRQNLRPSVSFAWLMAIILIPYIGVPAYLLFGGRKLAWWAGEKKPLYDQQEPLPFDAVETPSHVEDVLIAARMPPARPGSSMRFSPGGAATYRELFDLIENAKNRIHIMTFILGRDEVGRALIDRLSRKAAEGVEVRLLLDALGCMLTRGGFVGPLRRAGGRVGIFMPILPFRLRFSTHLRNHRKIIVIDGETAMIGGLNLTHNYIGPEDNPKRWIDTAAVLRGPVVSDLENIFESDWNFATGESLHLDCSVPPPAAAPGRNRHLLQIAASGPDVAGEPLYEALLTACFEARQRVWIVTPYFVPDDGLFRALLLQARLGHDVRLLLPKRSNHGLADVARGRFLRQLLLAGARVYLYPHRMIHAKHAVFDESLAMTGSANLDMRSLYLNYEVALFAHSRDEVNEVARWMQTLMDQAERVNADALPSGFVRQWAEDLSLLVSPLL